MPRQESSQTALLDRSGARPLWQAQSTSGHLLVAENDAYRWLEFGDGVAQSAFAHAQPHALVLPYTQWLLAALLFSNGSQHATVLGLGGGSVASFLARNAFEVVAVDADPLVVEAAARYFPLPAQGLDIRTEDARTYLSTAPAGGTDLIVVDLFTHQGMPRWLAHAAFHDACAKALAPGGAVCLNLAFDTADALDEVLEAMRAAYGDEALAIGVPDHANVIAIAVNGPHPDTKAALQPRTVALTQRFNLPFTRMQNAIFAAHGVRDVLRFSATAASLGLPY